MLDHKVAHDYWGRYATGAVVHGVTYLPGSNIAAFVADRFRAGWRTLVVHCGPVEVGRIGINPRTGRRDWWIGPPTVDTAQAFEIAERIAADALDGGHLAANHTLIHPTPVDGCFWCPGGAR